MNQQELELDFEDDTGSSIMSLYGDDVKQLQDLHSNNVIPVSLPPVLGVAGCIWRMTQCPSPWPTVVEVNIGIQIQIPCYWIIGRLCRA